MRHTAFPPASPTARASALAAAMTLALAAPPVQAARPFATEDAGVLASKDCEWESVLLAAHARQSADGRAWSNQIACGIGAGTQLALAYAAVRSSGQDEPAWMLAGKTELLAGDDQPLALTLAYVASENRPAGSHGYQAAGRSINLVGTLSPTDGWTAHANLGWARDTAADSSGFTWNIALETSLSETIDAGAEWLGVQHASPQWGLGLRYTPAFQFFWDSVMDSALQIESVLAEIRADSESAEAAAASEDAATEESATDEDPA